MAAPTVGACRCSLPRSCVTIRVYDLYGLSPETRQEALAMTAEALAHAGVQAVIVDCSAGPAAPRRARRASPEGEIVLRIHRHPKDGAHVLGDGHRRRRCRPEHHRHRLRRGDRRTVPAHRHAASRRSSAASSAHEIGHLLLGTNAHASHGLMRPSWQVQRLDRGDWDFTIEDAATIRRRLQRRDAAALLARAAP